MYFSINAERTIITDFITEAAGLVNTVPVGDVFTWVEYAQHFGVPTRLMDWTSNPLAALYFACNSNKDSNGRIYILNQTGYKLLVDGDNKNDMEGKVLKEEAVKMIIDSENTFTYPMLFKPYYLDRRMLAQASRFMVWGSKRETLNEIIEELEKNGKVKEMSSYCDCNGVIIREAKEVDVLSEVHIASKDKTIIQRELDNMGINQAFLFPGLDGIGRAIEWRYNKNNQRVLL